MEIPQLTLPSLPKISFLNEYALIIILIVFSAFYLTVSLVLMYHWHAYGMKSPGILFGRGIFLLISGLLFFVAFLSLSYL